MSSFRRNILHKISYSYTDFDAAIFKKYLHLPKIYLKGILRRYPTNLNEVPLVLPRLLSECDEYMWRLRKVSSLPKEEMIKSVQYKIARVPPMFLNREELPATSGTNLKVYQQIIDNVTGFAKLGRVLYLYSSFEENAMLAVSNIVKKGVDSKLKCIMLPLPTFMEEVKTFEESAVLKRMDEADISCLTLVGSIYKAASGFSETTMSNFVDQRRVAGKTTLLSAHLTPEEFKARYGIDLARFGSICMKFEDGGVVATVAQLAKELSELKGG